MRSAAWKKPVSYTHLDVYKRQAIAGVAGELGDHADQQCAGKGRAFAENVVKAKVLGGFLLGDDLGKVRPCLLYTSRCV